MVPAEGIAQTMFLSHKKQPEAKFSLCRVLLTF